MRPTDEQLREYLADRKNWRTGQSSTAVIRYLEFEEKHGAAIVEELLERRAIYEHTNFMRKLTDAAAEATAPIVFDWRSK